MDRIFLTLAMDLTETAPEGPGWYVDIIVDANRTMTPMAVSPETAYELAQDFQRAMQQSDAELPNFSTLQLVQSGSEGIYKAIQKQLAYAEEQALKIAGLRKKLQSANSVAHSFPTTTLESDESR